MMNQRGCSSGSLNQRGYLLAGAFQRSWTGLRTGSKTSVELSPWSLSVTGKLQGCLVE